MPFRRLTLLKGLEASAAFCANAFTLRRYCATLGHVVSKDRIATDLAWLEEQDMVRLARPEGVLVAWLTERGMDVASGAAGKVPGVALPQPGG